MEVIFLAKIPSTVVDSIREQANIVEIIGQYVQLKKAGKNYLGLCPFHNEKTPSFSVAEDKQIFHCFGCGKGGNVFRFIEEIDHLSFAEAVLKVADLEQIPIDHALRVSQPSTVESSPLLVLHDKAMQFYHHILVNTEVGQQPLDYLHQRGLTDELIQEFQIGFAPPQRTFLERIFRNESLAPDAFPNSGLFVEKDDHSLIDRFYQRIMFPIRNPQGKTIAFSGRWFEFENEEISDQPKYLNSPETSIFNKRDVLFNLDKAKATIRKENTIVLFEGFMDVIAAWQAGVTNGVASMGTSLTEQQIRQMEQLAAQLIFCYDGDQAGQNATMRGVQLLREHSRLKLTTLLLPEKLDPDEYIRKYGGDSFVQAMKHQQLTPFLFTMDYLATQFHLENEQEKLSYLEQLLKELTYVDSILEQDGYLTKIANQFDIQRASLVQQLQVVKRESRKKMAPQSHTGAQSVPSQRSIQQRKTQLQKAEELLLFRMTNDSLYRTKFKQQDGVFPEDHYQELFVLLDTYLDVNETFDFAKFLDFLQKDSLKTLMIAIGSANLSEEGSEQEFHDLMRQLKMAAYQQQINQKQQELRHASNVSDAQLQVTLAMEIIDLTRRLKNVD